MFDYQASFNKFLRELIKSEFPEINFYPEANFDKIKYPAITLHYGPARKTNTLSMWMGEVQIDILFNEWNRAKCNIVTQRLLELLNLAEDVPGNPRRTAKAKYINDKGEPLKPPQAYIPFNSDVQWRMADPVQPIYEDDMPELMRNTFTLNLYYRNR